MQILEKLLGEASKIANRNHEVLEALSNKVPILTFEDLFEIGRIFFLKQKPDSSLEFNDLIEQYPRDYPEKVLKGFTRGLEYILQNDLSETDRNDIYYILERRVKIFEKMDDLLQNEA